MMILWFILLTICIWIILFSIGIFYEIIEESEPNTVIVVTIFLLTAIVAGAVLFGKLCISNIFA